MTNRLMVKGYSILYSKNNSNDIQVSIDNMLSYQIVEDGTTLEITVPFHVGDEQFKHTVKLEFTD